MVRHLLFQKRIKKNRKKKHNNLDGTRSWQFSRRIVFTPYRLRSFRVLGRSQCSSANEFHQASTVQTTCLLKIAIGGQMWKQQALFLWIIVGFNSNSQPRWQIPLTQWTVYSIAVFRLKQPMVLATERQMHVKNRSGFRGLPHLFNQVTPMNYLGIHHEKRKVAF